MKKIREKIASLMTVRRARAVRWLKPALVAAFGLVAGLAGAQPTNDNFANAIVISGLSGSTNGDNTLATLESPCEANALITDNPFYNPDPITNSVWFKWTAPTSGTLTLDTAGSAFNTVLAVWTTTSGLCDPSLTNLISNDSYPDILNTAQVTFPVVAGRTYYISVNSYNDPSGPGFGAYVLNWSANIPTLPSGVFKFTSALYTVSETDSSAPDSITVNPSVRGARITVTRPEPAYGRVMVDYAVTNLFYTNQFRTNFYGANVLTTFIDTNGTVFQTNTYSTNIYVLTAYEFWNRTYQYTYTTNGTTNSSSLILGGVWQTNYPLTSGQLLPVDSAILPVITNSSTTLGGVTTTLFGYLGNTRTVRPPVTHTNGLTFTNGVGVIYTNLVVFYTNTFSTNYYGTNISFSFNAGGGLQSTNYYFTNVVAINTFYTNSIYTNGLLSSSVLVSNRVFSGLTNFAWSVMNASNQLLTAGPTGQMDPLTNSPLGSSSSSTGPIPDANGNITIVITNTFSTLVIGEQIVTSASGFTLSAGTLIFDNFQMSQDILVPVNQTVGPDFPAVTGIPSYAAISLSNVRLDPLEDTNSIIAPGLDPVNSKSFISALSTTFMTGPGVFNFERSTFQVNKNVNGGNAIISVNRLGGNAQNAVTVDYVIDPTPTLNGGFAPPANFVAGRNPANTFPRQAGSDYATPDSDYTPVSGTLSWGSFDYNPKQITIPILNNGLVEFNVDMLIQLYNPQPAPPSTDPTSLGQVNAATLTIPFDSTFTLGGLPPGQQPAGAVDRTWNKDGFSDSPNPYQLYPGTTPGDGGTVYAVATQPNGMAIIAGSFVSYDGFPYNRIVRTLPNGYQDAAFLAAPNSGANGVINALALQPDGKIIIAGNFTAFNGFNRHHIARLNPNGSVDTTFNPGLGANGRIWSVALESSGQIVIGGEFTTYNSVAVNEVARLNTDGSLDPTFNPGVGPDGVVDAVAVDASGRVIIGGDFATVAGEDSGAVARLNMDGSLDPTFTPGIGTFNPETFVTDPVHALAVQADGKILIGGSFAYYNLADYNGLARLNADGTLDLTFHSGAGTLNPVTGVADTVYSIVLQPDGNILIGGDFTTYNQTRRMGLARVFADGSLDTSFMDTAYNQFAGVPNRYYNPDAVATDSAYLARNTRNAVYAMALETGGNLIIGGTFTRVGGGTTRDDIHPRSNVARVIGGITPGPGNISFAYPSYTVNNSDGQLRVTLTRNNGNLGIISATFSTNTAAPGPGIASGADFSLNPIYANPTWNTTWSVAWMYDVGASGVNYDTIVTVTNSGNISGNLSANLGLSDPSSPFDLSGEYIPLGAALGAADTAPLTIIDSNVKPGVLGFSSPTYYVIGGSVATITITRTNGSDNAVTVWYATSNGTATNGVDYTGSTNQLSFAIGQTNATFTVPTLTRFTSIQPDKTVKLRLFTPGGAATLGLTNAVLTLINPNYAPGHVSFSATNYPVNENAGPAIITVNRLGGSSGTLIVTAIVAGGTAVNGVNYNGSTNTLTWNDGIATPKTISIPVMGDGIVTNNLFANLRLTNAIVNGVATNAPLAFGGTNATLTIVNVDSAGSFRFSSPVYSVRKNGGYALIPVIRTGGSVGTVTVNYTTLDDTAVQPANYTRSTNTLTFTNGEVSKVFAVPVIEDGAVNVPAGPKDLHLQLSTNGLVTLATLGSPTNATLYIIDSDSVNEQPGTIDTTYNASAGFNNNVYALALQSNNKLLVGGDFTMACGVTRNRIARLNADGTLDASFSLPSSAMGANGTVRSIAVQADGRILVGGFFTNFNSVARGHIARINPDGLLDSSFDPGAGADNPVYAVAQTFVGGESKILLGGAFASINGTTFNSVARINSDGTPDDTFNPGGLGANATVYALAVQPDGKIVIGGDFTAVNGNTNYNHIARLNADGSVDTNFVAGLGANDSVRTVVVQLDGKVLIGGVFVSVNGVARNHIARLNANGAVDGSFVPGVGADDVVFSIALQSDNRIILGGSFKYCNGVTRNRVTRLNPDGTVDPTINFGTGANDFVAAIAIQQDTIAGYPTNVPDEKIIIGGGFTKYNEVPHAHLARIFGGSMAGSGAFQFSSAEYQVDENGTNAVITVLRTGGTTNSATLGNIHVFANTSDGSAFAGTNYVAVSTNLDFPLGEVLRKFSIPVMPDGVVTSNLTVNLALTNLTAPAQIGNQPTAVLTIINDDTTVSFSSATYSVPKNIVSGVAAINVVRQGGISGTASVNFATTTGGTAAIGTDYTPVIQTVTFNPGVSNVTVYVPINNNGIPEGNRTVTLQLANASGTILASPTNAILTIIDTINAPGQLSFAAANYTITEGGGVGYTNAYITVIRTLGSSGTVSVGFNTQDGTAVSGAKYVYTNGVLTFADGETSKTFFVMVRNTSTAEGPQSLSVLLSNPTGGAALTSPAITTLTILNTNTGIAFASAVNSYTEPSGPVPGTVTLNVIRFNNTNGTITVNYSTTNVTAVAGTNFVGVTNGVLTFNPGESVKPIVITTLHDPRVIGDLFFTVGLATNSGSGGAQLTPPAFTVVTVRDAEAGIRFVTNAVSVARNAGYIIIPVICSNTNVEPVSVHYSTGGGTAVPGTDYTATSGTLFFTNGIAINYFYVLIPPNNQVQSNRTFDVTLSSPTPPGVLVDPWVETITIVGTNTPYGLSFSTPIVISGDWGSTNGDNTLGSPELGDPLIAGQSAAAPVWFQWTTPVGGDGEVTFDTIGSVNTNGIKLDTVLGVFTGNNLSTLSQVTANDDFYPLYPFTQINEDAQNIFNTNEVAVLIGYTIDPVTSTIVPILATNAGLYTYVFTSYSQPFNGPSGLRFNAKAGTTYYIAADTKLTGSYVISNGIYVLVSSGRGSIHLSWAYHPAGVFRFASEKVDQTGIVGTNGNPMLLYQCAETEGGFLGSSHRQIGPVNVDEYKTTRQTYYPYDVNGLLVTVTRVLGSSGRVLVDYTTVDGNTNIITNGDSPARAGLDYTAVQGTLIFDDFEMSKTIKVPIVDDAGIPRVNRDFMVVLSNARRDSAESAVVSDPRVDSIFGQALCRILDCDIDPKGPTMAEVVNTNVTPAVTNLFITDQTGALMEPTNALFNFSKANYRVPRDAQAWFGNNNSTPVTVYVNRMGTNRSSVTVHYRFDSYFLDKVSSDDWNNYFPLQPGSDYATPTPPNAGGRHGTNSDFAGVGGDSGTLTFPGGNNNPFQSQPIHFNIQNNHLPAFNKDIRIGLYVEDSRNNPEQVGMVAETTVTILTDDTVPPAGAVDQLYNPDFAADLYFLTNSLDLNSSVPHPGTDPLGEVYALALTTNNQAIIGGAFSTYADSTNTYTVNGLARLNANGSLDPTFNPGSGINVFPAGEFIRSLALSGDKVVIGGDFSSYNGIQRNGVARVNSDGSLDTTFAPGSGANGAVWSVLAQADGKVIIGGEFTLYNGTVRNHVARLNVDGSLDTTFNASNIITGPVYAMTTPPSVLINFNHAAAGGPEEDVQVLNLGPVTTGTVTVNYDMLGVPDDMRIFYGTTNVAAGTGVLLFDTGNISFTGTIVLPFGPVPGITANIITIVMNQGGSTNAGTAWFYNASVSVPVQSGLIVGGHFNVAGQTFANIARLNGDGSLNASFNPGTGPDDSVLSLAWQLDDKIIAGGAFRNISGVAFNRLARLNSNGSIDSSFYVGTGADNLVDSITEQPLTGLIYVGGSFTMINGTHRLGFARLYPDGTVDTTFLDTAYNQFAGLPRILFADAPGRVYASALQGDGNVMIGGSFQQVGGGQADMFVRYLLESERGLTPSTIDQNLWVSGSSGGLEPKTRDGVRNRSNVARLIGGATPGPGNIGMVASSYAVNKTQAIEPVTLVRANGSLGYASANFSVLPGLAQSGVDYSYNSTPPLYPIGWEYSGPTRMHSDGLFGANGLMQDIYGEIIKYGISGPAAVNVFIYNNTSSSGNLSAQFQMSNPSGADQFYLGGQNIPLGVALGISQAPLTVVDNAHQDGVFGFALPSYVATNSLASVAIIRTNGSFGSVQVSYQTTTNGSTAVAGTDYRPTNGVVPFNSGQTSNSFPVTILQNSYISSQEKTVNVELYNVQDSSGGNASLGRTNATVRIINPNFQGYLSFSTNAYYGTVSAGAINITVTRTVGSKGTLTVQYATTNGTATNGVDYIGATNTLVWNSGDVSSRTIAIPLINPNVVGPDKQFAASIFNPTLNGSPTPSLLGAITNATLIINNNNSYGTFQFSSPGYQVNENGGYATLTVTRTGSALGTGTVSYATADVTAFAGTNYVATNSTLTFFPGQVTKSFNVRLLDDGKTNPPPAGFYFAVSLATNSPGLTLGSPTNSLVHIVDAQSYIEIPGSVDTSFDSSAGMNSSVLALSLQANGQIVAGGSFTVANGASKNRLARFNSDGSLDGGFLNGLAGADGSVNALVSQTDDRIMVAGAFTHINGVVRQRVARLMTDGFLDTSFNPSSGADNTVFALAETFLNGARAIYAGGAFSTFNGNPSPGIVRLDNSGAVDSSFATGVGVSGTVYAVAAYPASSVYNSGKVLAGGQFTNFNGFVVGNLVRLNTDGSLDTNFNQNVSVNNAVRAITIQLDGSVLIGGDFDHVNGVVANHLARLNPDGTLDTAFNSSVTSGINGTVNSIAVQADNRIVVAGQFTLANGVSRHNITRLLPTGAVDPTINFGAGANGAVNAAVIQPADGMIVLGGDFTQYNNQPHEHIVRIFGGSMTGSGGFQFTSANYQIDETGSFATITIERTGGTSGTNADGSGNVFVTFKTTNGTAVAGVNYTGVTNVLDFPVGEVFKTVYVPVMVDLVITANLTVNLGLSNPSPGTSLGDQATALLTIINHDSVVKFLSATYSVPKNTVDGVATIDIIREGSTSGSCTVNFATGTNGTAIIGTDYYPTNALITFNPGDTDVKIQVPIINNGLPEGNRTISLELTNALNVTLASPSNAVLTIIDTVQAPGQLLFAATNFSANASDGVAYLTVVRTNGTTGSVTADYSTVPGTALPGFNYVTTFGTLTFNDGDTSKTFTIPLINNQAAQSAVSLTVNLSNPTGGATLIAPTNTTLTIYNTNAVFRFTLGTNSQPEDASPATVVVQRLNNTNTVSSVHYATANGTTLVGVTYSNALAGINYSNTSGTLTFGVGEVFKSISIPLIHNTNVTGDLVFSVGLSSPTNGLLLAPTNTLVIIQDAEAGISFTNSTMRVSKSAGIAVITVVCSNPRVEQGLLGTNVLAVSYSTLDGTAKSNIDYVAVSGTMVFTNGNATNWFYVPLFNNQSVVGDHAFTVILTNVTYPGVLMPPSTQSVVIVESNAGLRFSQANYNVSENGVIATINVLRTGFADSVVSVNYLATNGTAVAGVNFLATSGTLVFTNGVTSQSFNVPIIANTAVQPNLFALLLLSSPTNAQVVEPGAATLTILETGGSYVIPAGSQILSESGPMDGIIQSNETVQVLFAFRAAAGLDVTNLIAYLMVTNGVTSPIPASQVYGPLKAYGHSVSKAFTFTANGTNALPISPTFQLYDNGKFIGMATFVYTIGTWTTVFANTNAIIINDYTSASPYPSIINVNGVGNTLLKATVTLTNLSHALSHDIDALVVSPTTNTLIMAHAGGNTITHVTLTFDDAATNSLSQFGPIVTGTNKPTQFYPVRNFP